MKAVFKISAIILSLLTVMGFASFAKESAGETQEDSTGTGTAPLTALAAGGSCLYAAKGRSVIVFQRVGDRLIQKKKQLKLSAAVSDLKTDGETLLAASGNTGLYIIDISDPLNPAERGYFSSTGLMGTVTASGGIACMPAGTQGLEVVDVKKPEAPVSLGKACKGKDVLRAVISGNHVFAAANEDGLSVVALADDKTQKKEILYYTASIVRIASVSDKYVFMAGNANVISIADISSPLRPAYTGIINTAGIVTCMEASGDYLYTLDAVTGISVYDVRDIPKPKLVSTYNYPEGKIEGLVVSSGKLYAFDKNGTILTFDLSNPAQLKTFQSKTVISDSAADDTAAGEKTAYITIDDGPSRNNTPRNLDTLKEYGIKATFFVLPQKNLEDIYKRILDEGHVIGNHSYSHDYSYLYGSTENFRKDVLKAKNYIFKKLNYTTTVFRFPGGAMGRDREMIRERAGILKELGYTYFDWNASTADTSPNLKQHGTEEDIVNLLVNNVIKNTGNRKKLIVLMHETNGKTYTAKALPRIIEGLKKQGYTFDVLTNYSGESK